MSVINLPDDGWIVYSHKAWDHCSIIEWWAVQSLNAVIDDGSHASFLYKRRLVGTGRRKYKNMKKLIFVKCLLCVFLYSISISGYAQSYDVSVPKAGKLSSQIKANKETIISLNIQGEINGSDISYIRNLPNLEVLDLTQTKLVKGGKGFKVQSPLILNNTKIITIRDTEIPEACFSGLNKLKIIRLPSNIKWIDHAAFYNCPNLEAVTIQGNVNVQSDIFEKCPKLKSLVIGGKISTDYVHERIQLEQIELRGEINLDYGNWDKIEKMFTSMFIPRYIHFQKSGYWALYKSFGSDKIEEGVHLIWKYAFSTNTGDKSITNLTIPNTVVAIGYRAFQDCSNLSHVKFSSNLQTIMDEAFENCNLLEIELPSIEYIGKAAFGNNKQLSRCFLGNKLTVIQDQAFSGCENLKKIDIPETVKRIGNGAFYECKNLSTITALMKKPAKINVGIDPFDMSFSKKSVTTIFVPSEAYDAYMASAWNQYPLAKEGGKSEFDITVKNPGSLLSQIGIDNILKVKNLKLTGTLDDKDMQAIKQMVNLKCIDMENCLIIESQEKKEENKAYNNFITSLADLADETAKKAYQRREMSTGKYQRTQIGNTIVRTSTIAETNLNGSIIFTNIFTGLKFLETVLLPTNTKRIAHYAFANCPLLKNIKIPNGLLEIGDYAFINCVSLKGVNILSLRSLGHSSFEGCSQLFDINLPEGLLSIGEDVFNKCDHMTNICIPSTVKTIGNLFGEINHIKEIHCKGSIPPTLKFKADSNRRYKIFVPTGSSAAYYNSWGKLNIVEE